MKNRLFLAIGLAVVMFITACGPQREESNPAVAGTMTAHSQFSETPTHSITMTPTNLPTATNTTQPTLTLTVTATPEPAGCLKPIDDYSRVEVNGWTINRRTFSMLQHAQELYGGEIDLTGWGVTQGSYHDNGAASWGTHLGGGAVDLSVMRQGTYEILTDDIQPLVSALRAAGFAAWYREVDELFPGSAAHIHAVAIGDEELSEPARAQLDGPFGYFRGYSGVPYESGIPAPDRFGGPVLCQWMLDLGYRDLQGEP